MNQAKAAVIAAIITAIAALLGTILTVYQPFKSSATPPDSDATDSTIDEPSPVAPPSDDATDEFQNEPSPVIMPSSDAIAISSASELYSYITADMSGSFYLTQDIDMTAKDWNDKWTPLGEKNGSDTVPFTGTLDGRGHTILGVQNSDSSFGLFGILSGTVRNLRVDVQFGSSGNGGAFAAIMTEGGTIENCYASGTIIAEGDYIIGSFVGEADKGIMSDCLSTVNLRVKAPCKVGGMIGKASGATVTNCFFKSETYEEINWRSSWSMYVVSSSGVIETASDCVIKNCHYYYGEISSEIPARLRQQVTYTDWDWTVWAIDSDVNDGFPYLRTFKAEFQKT